MGRGIVRQATSDALTEDNGYYEATIIIDTLADDLGGEGVDVLVGIEGLVFNNSQEWMPQVSQWNKSGDTIGSNAIFQALASSNNISGSRLEVFGTSFDDTITYAAEQKFFDSNGRPTDIDDISWVEVRTDAGDDSYDLSYFKTLGLESNYREVRYEGSLSDYTVTLNNDGTVTVTHNSLSTGNTGTDTLTGAGDLIFVGDDNFRFNTEIRIDGNNIEGTLIGANLTDSVTEFANIQGNDNTFVALGGTNTFEAGAGNDTLRLQETPFWQADVKKVGSDWIISDNLGNTPGSRGTTTATDVEQINLEHNNGDFTLQINTAAETVSVNSQSYSIAGYDSDGRLLDANNNLLLDEIYDTLVAANTGNLGLTSLTGTSGNDAFTVLPGDRTILSGGGEDNLQLMGTQLRYTISYNYDLDENNDGNFDVTGASVADYSSASLIGTDSAVLKYVTVTDTLADADGGNGTDTLIGFERISGDRFGADLDYVRSYSDGSTYYDVRSQGVENDILVASDAIVSSMNTLADDNDNVEIQYQPQFGDIVIGSFADGIRDRLDLYNINPNEVGVSSREIEQSDLASTDLDGDGSIGAQDSVIAELINKKLALTGATSIVQITIENQLSSNDPVIAYGVDTLNIGGTNYNSTVQIRRDSEGNINDIDGTPLNDVIVGDNTDNWIRPDAGTDFIDGIANVAVEDQYWTPRDYLRFEGVNFERAEFNAVQVVVNADGTPGLDADKKIQIVGYTGEAALDNTDISFAASADAVTLGDGQELVAYLNGIRPLCRV